MYVSVSVDYNPRPHLSDTKAPLMEINSADNKINPPELRFLVEETEKVADGRAIALQISDEIHGHDSYT